MAINLTAEQKAIGKENFERVVGGNGLGRRDFLKGLLAAGAVLPVSAAVYYGYQGFHGKPVKTGLIGAGDEGGVLVGEHNPAYLEFVAYSDIRPSNQKRIFTGEPTGPRKGFNHHYGKESSKKIKLYENYKDMLADKEIEAVVIALPLHLHASAAIAAMKAGKHVLCEKLMAWNIAQCKEMIRTADFTDRCLSIGHQRHYSLLYAQATEVLKAGELGDVKYIRALWHRNNARPQLDANGNPMIDPQTKLPIYRDGWRPEIKAEDRSALESRVSKDYNYKDMEELVRWRLFNRTGGGLMAELGSHQLDACSIFLGKVKPVAVSGFGGKLFYRDNREVDDSVFVTFEFPGKNYASDPNDLVIVTYSSINTNSFEPYGECVMGSKGTMLVESEQAAMLFPDLGNAPANRSTTMSVASVSPGKAKVDSSGSTGYDPAAALKQGQGALGSGMPSRGYREEMEHFAYCVRMWGQTGSKQDRPQPRCTGKVAMQDAIIALTSNQAMKKGQRIKFEAAWYDENKPDVPDADMKA